MDKKDGGSIDLESLQRILALSEPTDDAELTTDDCTRVFVGVSPGELNRTIKGAIAELTARRARDAEAAALVASWRKYAVDVGWKDLTDEAIAATANSCADDLAAIIGIKNGCHDSDCAIHDAPAYPARLCDCNASTEPAAAEYTPGDYGMEVGATTHTPAAPLPLAYVAEVVQAQPDPGLGGLRGKCLSWPKGMVNFIVESAPGTRLYTKSLASNAGVPDLTAEDVEACVGTKPGAKDYEEQFMLAKTVIEKYRSRLIERMNGGGE